MMLREGAYISAPQITTKQLLEKSADYIEEHGYTKWWARGARRCIVGAMREVLAYRWDCVSSSDPRIVKACKALGYSHPAKLANSWRVFFGTRKWAVRRLRKAAKSL